MLIFGATPLGNLEDVSLRLLRFLRETEVIAAEDVRVAQRLLQHLGIERRPRLISFHDHNESHQEEIIELARTGDVLVLSDAGTPGISDPGFVLVQAAAAAGVGVTALPGPCAAITALLLSGLPADSFCFEGFLPRKSAKRLSRLGELANESRTMIFYEAPHRAAETLEDMVRALGPERPAAICREISKLHEETIRGSLAQLSARAQEGLRGELCLVVGGNRTPAELAPALAAVQKLTDQGVGLKFACEVVAELTGAGRRALYQRSLSRRRGNDEGEDA